MVRDLAVVFIYDDDTNTLKMSNTPTTPGS
ncbi:hypothetical protein SAMN06265784_107189 [Paraburkholderia susongensis]|uniref:Uncharacterized protein n=1 Tax=Paraburkholderia susongensis TaxID=1515439 RepID=A0A1X7LPQ3_9BURK|nr:hypothetical protein SAMN06265784_107189 [Paraburkholderia susongensis]